MTDIKISLSGTSEPLIPEPFGRTCFGHYCQKCGKPYVGEQEQYDDGTWSRSITFVPACECGKAAVTEPATNPEQLTGEALAAEVAQKVMGWRRLDILWLDGPHVEDRGYFVEQFRPDRDIAQAMEVEAAIESRQDWKLRQRYVYNLVSLVIGGEVGITTTGSDQWEHLCVKPSIEVFWRTRRATPEQICLAALQAMEARK